MYMLPSTSDMIIYPMLIGAVVVAVIILLVAFFMKRSAK